MEYAHSVAVDIAHDSQRAKQLLSERDPWYERIMRLEAEAREQGASFLSTRHLERYPRYLERLKGGAGTGHSENIERN